MSAYAIETKILTKEFKTGMLRKRFDAVVGLGIEVPGNEIYGLLGPAGSGKTTTVFMLMGLLHPTSGKIKILGKEVGDPAVKRRIGFLPQHPRFHGCLTGAQFLAYHARLFGMKAGKKKEGGEQGGSAGKGNTGSTAYLDDLFRLVGLVGAENRKLEQYSPAMIQRIGIAQALVNDPELMIMDEPMACLDPVGRKEIKDLFLRLKQRGKTVFYTTNLLADVEHICDRVGVLSQGKLLEEGPLGELFFSGKVKEFEVVAMGLTPGVMEGIEQIMRGDLRTRDIGKGRILFRVRDERKLPTLVTGVAKGGGKVLSCIPHQEALERCFAAPAGEKEKGEK